MRYGPKDVLSGVTFSAQRGEALALLGLNGAGKTTTIEILEGFRMRRPSARWRVPGGRSGSCVRVPWLCRPSGLVWF
jgi:ABC-2 type transport system ATP-binding protein